MIATLQPLMAALWIAQSQAEPATNPVAVGVGLLAVLVTVVLVWAIFRGRTLVAQLETLNKKLEDLTQQKRELGEKERKQAKDLEEKRTDINKLKKDIAAQRKKNHSATEENRQLRTDLAAQRETFDKNRTSRPAFAEASDAKKAEAPVVQKKDPDKSVDTGKAVSGTTLKELEEKSEQLRAANTRLAQELSQVREQWDSERGELKKIKKRIEDYRRIDVISAGKVTALEDRVNGLGRQYYEACTEIAVLKGEVPRLPPPEEYPPEREPKAAAPRQAKPSRADREEPAAAEEPIAAALDDSEAPVAADGGEQEIRSDLATAAATDIAVDPSADESDAAAV